MNDETGQGNELESLKYVLKEYVSIDDLKTRINTIDSNALNYFIIRIIKFLFAMRPLLDGLILKGFLHKWQNEYILREIL